MTKTLNKNKKKPITAVDLKMLIKAFLHEQDADADTLYRFYKFVIRKAGNYENE